MGPEAAGGTGSPEAALPGRRRSERAGLRLEGRGLPGGGPALPMCVTSGRGAVSAGCVAGGGAAGYLAGPDGGGGGGGPHGPRAAPAALCPPPWWGCCFSRGTDGFPKRRKRNLSVRTRGVTRAPPPAPPGFCTCGAYSPPPPPPRDGTTEAPKTQMRAVGMRWGSQ